MKPIELGPFDLVEPIARGGMGEVWRGVHRGHSLAVAIKVITRDKSGGRRFRNEVRAAARLLHPRVILVFDQGQVSAAAAAAAPERLRAGQPFLAMELARGGTLRDRRPRRWSEVAAILGDILEGLAHAHARGVIHRDLKPANILFGAAGDARPGLKISDFGIARALRDAEEAGGSRTIVGTLRSMAPEQIAGRFRDEGPWTDLYALGTIAYQLVCGRPLYGDRDGRELAHCHLYVPAPPARPRIPVPEGFQRWLDRLLAKRPERRFELAADAAAALAELPSPTLVNLGSATSPAAAAEPATAPATDHDLAAAGLGLWGLRPLPMVGRGAERLAMWKRLKAVAGGGRVEVLLVRGGAGYGKSRLVEDLAERAHEAGVARTLRTTHGPSGGANQGLRGLALAALEAVGLGRDGVFERALRLVASHPLDDDSAIDAAALAALATTEDGDDEVPRFRFTRPEERYRVVTRLLQRLSRGRPLIVWLEDVHHGADTLRYLAGAAGAGARVLAVATCTEEILAEHPAEAALVARLEALEHVATLRLAPLPPAARRELIAGSLLLSNELTREVAERAEGNPLFAVQLVGDWVQRGILELEDGRFVLAPGASTQIPDDIHQLWSERLERLAALAGLEVAGALEALELAAALGQQIETAEWSRACDLAGVARDEALLERLLDGRVALPSGGGWELAHGLARESLERRAREGGRWRRHHRACARMLEELYPESDAGAAARRGRHLVAAGDLDEATRLLLASAEGYRLAGEYALAHALHDERDAAVAALGLDETDHRWIVGRIQRATTLEQEGKIAEALEQLAAALWAAIEGGNEELVARAETLRGRLHFDMGAPLRARRCYERALLLFEKSGADLAGMAACLNGLGSVCVWLRELPEASAHLERARHLSEKSGDLFEVGQALRALAHVRHCERRFDEAEPLYAEARARFERAGCPLEVANCINDLGELARARGDLEGAEGRYREAGAIYQTLGAPAVMTTNYNLGLLVLRRGDVERASRIFAAELAAAEDRGRSIDLLWLHAGLLACAAAACEWQRWEEHAARLEALVEASGFVDEDIAELALVTGRMTAAAGERERARRIFGLGRTQLERMNHREQLEELERTMAELEARG